MNHHASLIVGVATSFLVVLIFSSAAKNKWVLQEFTLIVESIMLIILQEILRGEQEILRGDPVDFAAAFLFLGAGMWSRRLHV